MTRKVIILIISMICSTALAHDEQGDVFLGNAMRVKSDSGYTVLDRNQYQQTLTDSRSKIQNIINALQKQPQLNANAKITAIVKQLQDIPFAYIGAAGEGDWQPSSQTYQPGATHIKQDPVYRLDALNCQTLAEVAMALYFAKNLDDFDRTILKIVYGAAGNPHGEIVHYYNRNHFMDADWNPINQSHGFLKDVTAQGKLSQYAEYICANITRQNWFLKQLPNPAQIRVLNSADGPAMIDRFQAMYASLNFPHFDSQQVSLAYIPKNKIAIQNSDGSYQPNKTLLNKFPTPAIVQIVRDPKKWTVAGKNIKEAIGSELSISHLGLLYRKNFKYGDTIYQKITCAHNDLHNKVCTVKPILCNKKHCNELMFAHATSARPNGYYWYKNTDNNFICSPNLPSHNTTVTQCNRVAELPLFDYLTDYQYGTYTYMKEDSIIGVHVELLASSHN